MTFTLFDKFLLWIFIFANTFAVWVYTNKREERKLLEAKTEAVRFQVKF